MATVSVTGSGPYTITADEYKCVIDAYRITELYLLKSSTPATNIAGGIYPCLCWGSGEDRHYSLSYAGVLTLEEDTPARVVVKCTGDMQPTPGGTTRGTGTWHAFFYPDRINLYVAYNMSSNPAGGTWSGRLYRAQWPSSVCWDVYRYAKLTSGAYSGDIDPAATDTDRDTGGGPWSIFTGYELGATDYSVHATVKAASGFGTLTLVDHDTGTWLVTSVNQAIALSTTYKAVTQIDFLPLDGGAFDEDEGSRRCEMLAAADNLSGAEGRGEVITGTRLTDRPMDIDADSFAEGMAAWTVQAASDEIKVKWAKEAADGPPDLINPAVYVSSLPAGGILQTARRSTNGTDWTGLVSGTDYNVQTSGTTRIFQYLATADLHAAPFYLNLIWVEGATGQGTQILRGLYQYWFGIAQTLSGRFGHTTGKGTQILRGIHAFTTPQGTQELRGIYSIPTVSQGVQVLCGRYMVGVDTVVQVLRGVFGYLVTVGATLVGLHRLAADTDEYALYRGVDTAPDFDAAPYETFTTLPHETAALAVSHTYHFVLRLRNDYSLGSHNVAEWTVTIDGAGDVVSTPPSAPTTAAIEAAGGGKAKVTVSYLYGADGSDQADKWLFYHTADGVDPDPDIDEAAVFTMTKVDGVAKKIWLSPAYDDETTIKVLARTRRSGTPNVDSENVNILQTTADTDGPAEPAPAGVFFGTEGQQL